MNNLILSILILFISFNLFAQKERALVRKGNKHYNNEDYVEAEVKYKKAIEKKYDLVEASFNLGDALFKQKRYDTAAKLFELSANLSDNNDFKSKSYHNLGNSYLEDFKTDNNPQTKGQKLNQSIEAYKTALKHNPKDLDTKYNLSYALKLRSQQQSNQNKQNQQYNQKQDQHQEQQQQQQDQQRQEEKKQQENQADQKKELSKEDAERMLKALQNEEKEVQKKLMKKKAEPVKIQIEKDW